MFLFFVVASVWIFATRSFPLFAFCYGINNRITSGINTKINSRINSGIKKCYEKYVKTFFYWRKENLFIFIPVLLLFYTCFNTRFIPVLHQFYPCFIPVLPWACKNWKNFQLLYLISKMIIYEKISIENKSESKSQIESRTKTILNGFLTKMGNRFLFVLVIFFDFWPPIKIFFVFVEYFWIFSVNERKIFVFFSWWKNFEEFPIFVST